MAKHHRLQHSPSRRDGGKRRMNPSPRLRAALAAFVSLVATTLIASLCAASANAASSKEAARTWRCGNAYSDQPCEGGRRIDTADPRSAENQRAAEAATLRIERKADAMARERMQLENSAAGRGSVSIIADPRVAARKERLALQAAQRKIDREDEARRKPRTVHDKRVKVKPAS
ncbi:hypothetical protein ACSFA3_20575 [Variovorax sp. RHLX14]|uniref:hypothetical protein n=1 Tax=Variovorax sp. RHLX14 TaxID=1259731 RepID=UPI003F482CFE